jgi:hypothetical protein
MNRSALALVALGVALLVPATAHAAPPVPISFHAWQSSADFNSGTYAGTTLSSGAVTLASRGTSKVTYPDSHYGDIPAMAGTWTSPIYDPALGFTELVSSWNADTPSGTWIQVELHALTAKGTWTKWYVMGRWAYGDDTIFRTSVGGQGDADGYVAIDTFFAKDHVAVAYRLKVTLFRRAGSSATPTLTRLSAVAMNVRNQKNTFPSATTGVVKDLNLPLYSQEIHHGDFPQYDNGGEAWCSPTSTAMVVRYWGSSYQPTPLEYEWVTNALGSTHADPWVDFTARAVYDYRYNGAGNWPFNAAYAASRGLVGDVSALHNLREAEPYIQAGVPLVASVAWSSNKLEGAIKSTNGHLMVIGGFEADGDVIAYDPASDTDALVRHVYDREQFERAWIPASGGIVYVIRPAGPSIVDSLLTANNS